MSDTAHQAILRALSPLGSLCAFGGLFLFLGGCVCMHDERTTMDDGARSGRRGECSNKFQSPQSGTTPGRCSVSRRPLVALQHVHLTNPRITINSSRGGATSGPSEAKWQRCFCRPQAKATERDRRRGSKTNSPAWSRWGRGVRVRRDRDQRTKIGSNFIRENACGGLWRSRKELKRVCVWVVRSFDLLDPNQDPPW